jgi:hypothetical protein
MTQMSAQTCYWSRAAKRLWLCCFLASMILSVTVLSGQCAPKTSSAIKDASAAAPGSNPSPNVATFAPESGEFSILMPGHVRINSMPARYGQVPTYLARAGTTNYVVTGINVGEDPHAFDQYFHGFVHSMTKQGDMSVVDSDASGQGWTGKLCNFTRNGNERVSAIVAKATGSNVIYSAMIDAPASSEQSKRFLGSLVIYPDKAIAAHLNDPGAKNTSAEAGQMIGTIVGALLGLALAIFLVKRFPPPKKKDE